MSRRKVAVLVAGSWGTALASLLAGNDLDVTIWSRNASEVEEINQQHRNSRYFKEAVLSPNLRATHSIAEAVAGAEAVVLAAPTAGMRELAGKVRDLIKPDQLLVHVAKGFELGTHKRMTTVIAEEIPHYDPNRIVVLSGPSHAEEVVLQGLTTVVVAAGDLQAAEAAQDLFINHYFRVYTNPDVIGVEVGGALKNIIALGAGLTEGLGYGDNAKAALMTRGLAEITRLGVKMGAKPQTFAGLAGIGDLIVTCTSKHSRNWRAGYLLGQGKPLDEVLQTMGMVVEGVKTTKVAYELALQFQVSMPITEALYEVLFQGKSTKDAVKGLMGRLRTHELEEVAIPSQRNWVE